MHKKPCAVIFAGGKSSRMGKDKALLPFGRYSTLSEFQHQKLVKLFDKVYISAKSNKFDFACNVIEDRYKDSSPLVGLISIFETTTYDEIFILSVDAPFVDKDTIDKIFSQNNKSSDATIAYGENGAEPLCGIYKRAILTKAKQQLADNNHRLTDLLKSLDTSYVKFSDRKVFINLNYSKEYELAYKEWFDKV